jgi:hypothetical protein
MNGHRNEDRSWGRNEDRSGYRILTRSGGCCGRWNEGRIRGRSSPNRPGDRKNPDNAEVRMQIPEVRILGTRETWCVPRDEVRRQKPECRRQKYGTG